MAGTPISEYLELFNYIIAYHMLPWLLTTPVIHYHQTKDVFTSLKLLNVTIVTVVVMVTCSIGIGSPNWLPGPMKYA